METLEGDFLTAVELHSIDRLKAVFDAGLDPQGTIKGLSPITCLTEMYFRSDDFPACLQFLLDRGCVLDDPALLPVLLDDADMLIAALSANPTLLAHRTTMVSTFTPLVGATLLHVAAEYGSANASRVLIEAGADVNATAALDDFGLNGHTPIFHTVNSNANRSEPIMRQLLEAGARSDIRLQGITWGKGFEWETTLFDVTPISYAQFGLLPQVHRKERDIHANIKTLLNASGRKIPPLENVPNRYLNPK